MKTQHKKTIYFRADGNTQIGLGHIIRCQSLANMIKTKFKIKFCSRYIPIQLIEILKGNGYNVIKISKETEFLKLLKPNDGVVVDGYMFSPDYNKKILESGSKLALIDDLHEKELCANIIINPAPGITENHYKVDSDCSMQPAFALGPQYALLRPAFLKSIPTQKKISNYGKLLICFGGSDVKNLTEQVLKTALDLNLFKKIIIITGSAYTQHHQLEQKYSKYSNLYFLHAVDEKVMAEKLLETDVAIVPASGMLYEALSMQRVVISGIYVENQKNVYEGFKGMNAFIDAGTFEKEMLTTAFEKIKTFKPKLLIDRKSPGRYRTLFEQILH